MKISGHTPLDSLDQLPDDLRAQLRGMWIESVEEFLALAAAVGPDLLRSSLPASAALVLPTKQKATALIGAPKVEELMQPRAGGALGCALDPELVELLLSERNQEPKKSPATFRHAAPLPPAVRLMDRLGPVRDQGTRGTCVAFSSVALREFLDGGRTGLSEQFLYWGCKELDGLEEEGTFIRTAMTALNLYGTCHGQKWSYHGAPIPGNEGQGPPPPGAVEDARTYQMVHSRAVEPRFIDMYKQILAGSAPGEGMPVVFAVIVFDSWFKNPEAHLFGKVNLPLPDEPDDGGHAMCMVGYVDDADVPGGGYFIARNSWSAAWAPHSPEAPGHALIPYEYIARFCVEAFSGPLPVGYPGAEVWEPAAAAPEDELAPYVRRLKSSERDVEGRLFDAGAQVLFNPVAPEEFMEDTPANRLRFAEQDHTWAEATRARVWFPSRLGGGGVPEDHASKLRIAKEQFLTALEKNLEQLQGMPLPEVRFPVRANLVPGGKRVRSVRLSNDLSGELARTIAERAGSPEDVAWPDDYRELLRGANALRVFELENPFATVHVVVGFVSQLGFAAPGRPRITEPTASVLQLVREIHEAWAADKGTPPSLTLFTLGSALSWPDDLRAHVEGDPYLVLSNPKEGGGWESSVPQRAASPATEAFYDCLEPYTSQERLTVIRRFVEDLLQSGFEGNVRVEKISRETGYRRDVVEAALRTMKQTEDYSLYRTSEGDLAVKRNG